MIKYTKGYKYQLYEPTKFITDVHPSNDIETNYLTLTTNGTLYISSGYAWDGASGPTIDSKSSMQASLVHDALYQLMRLELLDQKWRTQADQEFFNICVSDGMCKLRAKLWYLVVRGLASPASSPKNRKKIYTTGR